MPFSAWRPVSSGPSFLLAAAGPGRRAEVTGTEGRTRLYAVLRHGRHVLLISGPGTGRDWQPRMRHWQDEVDVVTTANGRPGQPGHGPSGRAWLLRPDGYVAARGSVARPDNVLDYLHRLFGTAGAQQPAPASVPPA